MNINRGDKMDYLVAMMSEDFTLKKRIEEKAILEAMLEPKASDALYESLASLPLVEVRSDGLALHPTVHEAIAKKEVELETLKSEYAALKKSL